MKPEDFFKTCSETFSAPIKTTRRIRRFRPERGDGITAEEVTIRLARLGQLHEIILDEEAVPSCGHLDAAAIVCAHPDPNTPLHMACSNCAVRCSCCARMFCPQHAQEIDGQFLCAECVRQVKLDGILQGLLGWLKS